MMWMTWRQHRGAAAGALIALAAICALLIPDGFSMHHTFDNLNLTSCTGSNPAAGCSGLLQQFRPSSLVAATPWFALIPLLLGVLAGAPLVARELETGTYRLVWAQATTRTRWITVKLCILALGVTAVSAAFAMTVTWWRAPVDALTGTSANTRLGSSIFNVEGPVVVGYALFAFFLGVLAGAILKRTLPAIVAAGMVLLALLLLTQTYLRPHYLPPVTTISTFSTADGGSFAPDSTGTPGDWLLDWGVIDAQGHRLDPQHIQAIMGDAYNARTPIGDYLNSHGIRHLLVYQPAGRFWTFQLIETGLYLGAAAILAVTSLIYVQRRLP